MRAIIDISTIKIGDIGHEIRIEPLPKWYRSNIQEGDKGGVL